jgi:diguanylate cyclase (GGDEF)-like protein
LATTSNWSTQQLTEFLAAITGAPNESSAEHTAVERAAEAFDCEIGALVRRGSVVASVGFPADSVPERELIEAAEGSRVEFALPGGQIARVIPTRLDDLDSGAIVLARSSVDAFRPDEVILLRGMVRVLAMTLTTIRTVESLQQRQELLEKSAAIQHAITIRAPLQEVLDLIAQATSEVLGGEGVGMRMLESDNPERTRVVASVGLRPVLMSTVDRGNVDQEIGRRAITEDRLVVVANEVVSRRLQSGMAAPIHDRGTPIGSLCVASDVPGRIYSVAEQETLSTFAQLASLALMDSRMVDELLRQALHDPLTSLANRALFSDRLEHALARAERAGSPVAVLFLDLDRFKGVNDNLGHAVADELLIDVGKRLVNCVRSSDTVARFGGDEFALLIEDIADQSALDRLSVTILDQLRQPFVIGQSEISITASVGIAVARRPSDDPIRDADLAMYRAKSSGRNRHEFFEDEMRVAMRKRLKLEAALQGAIAGEEFVLHYQPIVDLNTGTILGLEALIRWRQPGGGLVPPNEFIPLAEETGAIFAIGRWALRDACERASAWQPRGANGIRPFVSVNISPIQLIQIDLASEVASVLAQTQLDPSRLVLEITETSLLDDATALRKLRALKKLGVRLAVDDFGTGYSSLHYLQKFQVDALKIAKPFIDELGTRTGNATLAQAIIDLGRTFKLDVIAEGIDREEKLTHLRKLGCNVGQGFLLARPLDANATEALLRNPLSSLPRRDPSPSRTAREASSVKLAV